MKIAVNFNVNLDKLEQARIFQGQKGRYADLTCFIDTEKLNDFGSNGVISQKTSKEERDQGVKTPICGDVQLFWRDDGQPVVKPNPTGMTQQVQQQVQQLAPQQAPPGQQAPPQAPPQDFSAIVAEYLSADSVKQQAMWNGASEPARAAINAACS